MKETMTASAMTSSLKSNKGFTLIEMAIVLVIIGIIISAVVKGGDLIENAKDKQVMGEINTIKAAYYTYYDKKGVIPTAITGSLVYGSVGVDAPTTSKPRPGLTYTIDTDGSLKVTNAGETDGFSSLQAGEFDTKYDDGTYNTGAIRADAAYTGTTGYIKIRLK